VGGGRPLPAPPTLSDPSYNACLEERGREGAGCTSVLEGSPCTAFEVCVGWGEAGELQRLCVCYAHDVL
jgi:hypothetical protein